MPFDWQTFHTNNADAPVVVDPRRRLSLLFAGFAVLGGFVVFRIVQLEVTEGAAFRAVAMRPVEREIVLPATRGRILTDDGAVLACDRTVSAVAVAYRWLQDPPDDRWLRATVRSRLRKSDRKNADNVAKETAAFLAERRELGKRLARLCGVSAEEWTSRARRIQSRVERIAASANRRQQAEASQFSETDRSWAARLRRLLFDGPPPPRIVVQEETEYHVMVEDIPAGAVAELSDHPDRYRGAKLLTLMRRSYPGGTLAAHVVGHLGPDEEQKTTGRMGIERQCEATLQAHPGVAVELADRSGRTTTSYRRREPVSGGDVALYLHAGLQRAAEELLREALERRTLLQGAAEPAGGAIVVMEVHSGAVRAAAAAPAFDPNVFVEENRSPRREALLNDPTRPFFNRFGSMALPPGSTFKPLTTAALLESATIGSEEPWRCRGYLREPDRQRCEIFVRQGTGHGDVALADALAVSCNVFFFHFAGQMGPRPLVDWAERFGFGQPTGIDLPGEASGTLPNPENIGALEGHAWRTADTQSMAVGQGSLTATPLQVLCMMAAFANGGKQVTPRVIKSKTDLSGKQRKNTPPEPRLLPGLHPATIETIRRGLHRVVSDPRGTGYETVRLESIAVAGKTGTAETGADRLSHAWFAGYAPAESPQLAFVVVLEHGGGGATAAGPVAKRLVLRMQQLGLLPNGTGDVPYGPSD